MDAAATLQLGLAAAAAYALAHLGLGHEVPFLAATVAVTSLGLSRDVRPLRVLETAIGITGGIALSELLMLGIGKGVWQLGVIVTATLLVARLVSASTAFAVLAAVQASMVVLLPDPEGGPFMRAIDGMVGAGTALLLALLLPRNGRRLSLGAGVALLDELRSSLAALAEALRRADLGLAAATLEQLRATQPLVSAWQTVIDSAQALARSSPLRRGQRAELARHAEVLRAVDFATRNVRVIARRVDFLVEDARPRPVLAELLDEFAAGFALLTAMLADPAATGFARQQLVLLAGRLDPEQVVRSRDLSHAGLVLLLRSLAIDLLMATGADEAAARRALPVLRKGRWGE